MLSFFILILAALTLSQTHDQPSESSVYTLKPADPEAFYFTPDEYDIKADGRTDVSDALQEAINDVKEQKNYGILFIPEGKYLISNHLYTKSGTFDRLWYKPPGDYS